MKKILYLLFFVITLLAVSNVNAAASFSLGNLEFGSQDQERGEDVTQTLQIINDGTENLNLVLSSTIPTIYDVRLSSSTITVAAGTSANVIVTLFIPEDQDSDRVELTGGISVVSSAFSLTKTAKTYVTVASMLEITKVSLDVDGDTSTLSDGENYDELKAGVPITLTVTIRNNFDSTDRLEINDIEIDLRSSGDLDLDDSEDIDDLDYGDKDSVTFTADIPSDADDGDDYDIDIEVTGRDENGVWHSDTYSATIEVNRESHDISITDVRFSPKTVSCNGKVTITVDLENTGKYSEDNVQLEIRSDDLDIEKMYYESDMDKDDTARESYSFTIANNTPAGLYDFFVTSYYDVKKESNTEIVTLEVLPCTVQTSNNANNNVNNNAGGMTTVTQPSIPQVIPATGAVTAYGTASFMDSSAYMIVLVAAVIVLLLILIILLVKFVF